MKIYKILISENREIEFLSHYDAEEVEPDILDEMEIGKYIIYKTNSILQFLFIRTKTLFSRPKLFFFQKIY
jgi:hypothetical protein